MDFDAGLVGDIATQSEGAHAEAGKIDDGMLGVGCRIAVSDGDIRARPGKSEGGGASETARGTGDETGLAPQRLRIECRHFRILLPEWIS